MNDPQSLPPELAQIESQLKSQLKSLTSSDEMVAAQTMSAEAIAYWMNVGRQRQLAEQHKTRVDDRSVASRSGAGRLKLAATHLASAAAAALLVFGLTFPPITNSRSYAPVANDPQNSKQTNAQSDNHSVVPSDTVANNPDTAEDAFVPSQNEKHWRAFSSTQLLQTEAALERMLAENQRMKRPRLTTPMRSELAPINFDLLHSQNSVWSLQQRFFTEEER